MKDMEYRFYNGQCFNDQLITKFKDTIRSCRSIEKVGVINIELQG